MVAVIEVSKSTELLRDRSLIALAVVYLLPAIFPLPPSLNVVLTATITVFAACLRTVGKTHEAEILSQKDAIRYPVIGSAALLSLFVAIKFLPKNLIVYIITGYFCLVGIFAIGELLYSTFHHHFPEALKSKKFELKNVHIPYLMDKPDDISITAAQLICNCVGLVFSTLYVFTRHFLCNNGLGLAYSLEGIAMLNLGSMKTGVILLWGLFLYDVWWVFFTPVMVAVATKIDGPIKLLFPTRSLDRKFNMLGLGDIVIPGLFVALMLHFDARNNSGKRYFYSAMGGYAAGLAVTIVVMNVFKAAQPALLYIVPCVCLAVFAQAVARGEVKQLWAFEDNEPNEAKSSDGGEGSAEGLADRAAGAEGDDSDIPAELRTFDAGQSGAPGFEMVGELKKAK